MRPRAPPLGRPWLTPVLDVCTRCVLGLHVAFDAPSSAGVALAVAQAVLPKDDWLASRSIRLAWPMHGLPGILHLDNAREFHACALRVGCQQHGIQVEYRPPATPRFGGHIERLMGTLMGRVHALPGTTFSNVAKRADYPFERRAVLSLAEFERVLALEVLGPYHNVLFLSLMRHGGGRAGFGRCRPEAAIEHFRRRAMAQAPPRRRVQPNGQRVQAAGRQPLRCHVAGQVAP